MELSNSLAELHVMVMFGLLLQYFMENWPYWVGALLLCIIVRRFDA